MKRILDVEKIAVILLWLGALIAILSIIAISWNRRIFDLSTEVDVNAVSALGSLFSGAVVGLWSLGSVLLLYKTVSMQKEQVVDSSRDSSHDRAETILIHLLNLQFQGITFIEVADIHDRSKKYKGREAFTHVKNWLKTELSKESNKETNTNQISTTFFRQLESSVTAHLLSILSIIRYVDSSNIIDKEMYMLLIRAQLSVEETFLLYFFDKYLNNPEFSTLINKHNLIDLSLIPQKLYERK